MKNGKAFEYEIYIPVNKRAERKKKASLARIKKQLISIFGGLTDTKYSQRGLWKIGSMTIQDQIVIWRIISFKLSKSDRIISKVKLELERTLDEKEILVVKKRITTLS